MDLIGYRTRRMLGQLAQGTPFSLSTIALLHDQMPRPALTRQSYDVDMKGRDVVEGNVSTCFAIP